MNMEKNNRKERDGREIMRRLDSDELMSPTPEMWRELPLSSIGDRTERYHKILMARTRTHMLLMSQLSERKGIDLEKAVEQRRWEMSPESSLDSRLTTSTAADSKAIYEGRTADGPQNPVVQDRDLYLNGTSGNKKSKRSWRKRVLRVFSWCRGSTRGKGNKTSLNY
uniref:Uncharacterized protein LOC111128604 n=1 Tax=Crassostrea virginica TaxID=6565 RepID=A0A8B8DPA2_CRAVI|nr:uncharacterized protein LOC111128604 [Crassostrea virginica]